MDDFTIFQLSNIESRQPLRQTSSSTEFGVTQLEAKFSTDLRDDLPPGLPLKRKVDHEVETFLDRKAPHHPIFQLSPAELLATKE